ncbi:hypothetical protein CARUB_v10003183mg [Capsella rubella]|uniref:At2g29880-like C-terminal domain-containing protein n=1 Tax=Capsella rubella TaxID=81985 RepID=R0H015_9BRAS|nr:hypothetical protein CARUB_v10003183mg [Capsella rubella]
MLVQLLVDAINQGFCIGSGKFDKLIVETRVLTTLNQNFGTNKTHKGYKNRLKVFSCSGWDPETKKLTATDEVLYVFAKAHSTKIHLHDESFEDFGDLQMIFESNITIGRNVVGISDAINAYTYQVEDNEAINNSSRVQIMEDEEIIFGLTQKTWEKVNEEKEGEDKANNVWEAIKRISELDEDLCYEAMTLIHNLGMKYGFTHMLIADRNGWIIQNLCKP